MRFSRFVFRHAGFTLVELMMVLAVLAILALMAVPSLRDRMVRQQVAEALPLVDFAKQAIAAQYAATAKLPADNAAAGLPPADKIVSRYIQSVTVNEGALVLTFSEQLSRLLAGRKISVRAATVDGYPSVPISWICGHAAVPANMSAHGADDTTVDAAYLPFGCRAGAP